MEEPGVEQARGCQGLGPPGPWGADMGALIARVWSVTPALHTLWGPPCGWWQGPVATHRACTDPTGVGHGRAGQG